MAVCDQSPRRPASVSSRRHGFASGAALSKETNATADLILGDTDRRVTVKCPQNLYELQKTGAKHFGGLGLGFHHHGKHRIKERQHLSDVQHGDVVVVSWDNRKATRADVGRLTTTQRRDYVVPPLKTAEPTPRKVVVQTPRRQQPLDDRTCYKDDFVDHACKAPEVVKAIRQEYEPRSQPTGSTTYKHEYRDFSGHDPEKAFNEPVHTLRTLNCQRTYQSTYEHSFAKPNAIDRPSSVIEHRHRLWFDDGSPFSGVSSYAQDYVDFASPRPSTSYAPRKAWTDLVGTPVAKPKLDDKTEYRTSYTEKELEKRKFIHLEPAMSGS